MPRKIISKRIAAVLVTFAAALSISFVGLNGPSENGVMGKMFVQAFQDPGDDEEYVPSDTRAEYLMDDESPSEANEAMYKEGRFPIYTANISTYAKEVGEYIYLGEGLSLKEKLSVIADKLSADYFDNLPVQVLRIENRGGRKIAVINLKESDKNQGITDASNLKGSTWAVGFLQGSCGGCVTSTTLIESFLQRDYKDEWIDGVRFMYNNSGMEKVDTEHAPALCSVNLR